MLVYAIRDLLRILKNDLLHSTRQTTWAFAAGPQPAHEAPLELNTQRMLMSFSHTLSSLHRRNTTLLAHYRLVLEAIPLGGLLGMRAVPALVPHQSAAAAAVRRFVLRVPP